MKKITICLTLFCMMMLSASALVPFNGELTLPYLVYGHLDWQNQALGGARIEITNMVTGYSTIITTNADGYWQEQTDNWLTSFPERMPAQAGDLIKIKTLDGCGTNDVCEKTFTAKVGANRDFAQVDLSVSGVLVITVPSSSGSSGGSSSSSGSSSSGGGGGSLPAWVCGAWSECVGGKQTQICAQGQFTRKDTQSCTVPVPIVPPIVIPPVVVTPPKTPTVAEPELYTCSNGEKVVSLLECPIESKEHEQEVVNKILNLKNAGIITVSLAAMIIGLYLYRRRKGKLITAEKGAKTFIDKRTK